MKKLIKCSTCKGTGKWDNDPCPDCMGCGYEIPDKFLLDDETLEEIEEQEAFDHELYG